LLAKNKNREWGSYLMARIRSVFPGLFTDEAFVSLSMAARILILGIWTDADDQGIFEWKPLSLKMRIFSADNIDVVPLLAELVKADIVRPFSFEGKPHGAVRNFCKYQKPKSPKFRNVTDDEIRNYVASKYPKEENEHSKPEPFPQKGEIPPLREEGGESLILGVGLGGGEKPAPAKASRSGPREGEGSKLTLDFTPSDATMETIHAMGFGDRQFNKEFSRFIPYYKGRGTLANDWDAMLITWFQRATAEPAPKVSPPANSKKIHVKVDTEAWRAWCEHLGKAPPTDRNFGWMFDSEWPPGFEKTKENAA
jgi:hypothetical protein